jgi:chorismate mutase
VCKRFQPTRPVSFAVVVFVLTGCSPPGPAPVTSHAPTTIAGRSGSKPPPAVGRLLRLMRDRLVLMHDVARTKWNSKRPVGDPEREQALLRKVEAEGRERGLDPPFTRAFFAAQIAAARRVQEADCARWRAEERGPFHDAPGLAALRKRIDGLNRELLGILPEARPQLADPGAKEHLKAWAQEILTGEGITDDVRAVAIEPLAAP